MKNKGQQEMVGFVLIVVLVVVVMMVFLVISLRDPAYEKTDSLEVTNMLNSIMSFTTNCAIVFEPQYDSVEDLVKSAHMGDNCANNAMSAKIYLETIIIPDIMETLVSTEATVLGYEFSVVTRDDSGEQGELLVEGGDCSESAYTSSSQRMISSGAERLLVRLKLCQARI